MKARARPTAKRGTHARSAVRLSPSCPLIRTRAAPCLSTTAAAMDAAYYVMSFTDFIYALVYYDEPVTSLLACAYWQAVISRPALLSSCVPLWLLLLLFRTYVRSRHDEKIHQPPSLAQHVAALFGARIPGRAILGPTDTASSDVRWRDIGDRRPAKGRELDNHSLKVALATRTRFTKAEHDEFGLAALHDGDCIQSGGSIF
eukprot:4364217-Prymnesium_polylepis.1